MRLNSRMIFIISIMCATLAFSMTINTLNKLKQRPDEASLVVVAMKDLDVGIVVNDEDVQLLAPPQGTDFRIALKSIADVSGKRVRNPIRRGKVLTEFDLVRGDDDMTGLIPKGYRASTILIEIPKEVISFLKFGNRVDILYTERSNEEKKEPKMIMQNILVMKVSKPDQYSTTNQAYVTVALKPQAMETLAYAVQNGRVDLSVRPITDTEAKEVFMTFDELMGVQKGFLPAFTNQTEVELIKGIKKETVKL